MNCPNCGEELEEDFNYCPFCEENLAHYDKATEKLALYENDLMSVKYKGKEYRLKKREGLLTLNLSNKGIQNIREIRGLNLLTNLEALILDHNNLTEISGLQTLISLKKLDLSSNKISKIEGLEQLINLEQLNLEYNELQVIESLDNLKKLRELSFFGNKIYQIKSFKNKDNLKRFLLGSSNPIYSELKDIFGIVTSQKISQFLSMAENEKSNIRQKTREEQWARDIKLRKGRIQQKHEEFACFAVVFIIGLVITIIGGATLFSSFSGGGGFSSLPLSATFIVLGIVFMGIGSKGECCANC